MDTIDNYNVDQSMDKALRGGEQVKPETEETRKMKKEFGFFGLATFAYAVLYAFCMYKNDAGITFPFFAAGSLLFLCFSLKKLGISLKKDSVFYMISMMLLAVSTFCTDDKRIIFFNKTGIFCLMMSLLVRQFCDTSRWKLGKYFLSICQLIFGSLSELERPFSDLSAFIKSREGRKDPKVWYAVLGMVIALPVFAIVFLLLSSADAVFRHLADMIFRYFNISDIFGVIFRIAFFYLAVYVLACYLCDRRIKEEVKNQKNGEPVIAITITGMLSLLYLVFSGVQILYLFIGNMQLPDGYTYAEYAREGFFQLLAVGILNFIIVLVSLNFFRDSRVLRIILTIMSLCSFIMIASSAMRMIIYIQYYYLTFLRLLVLWALIVLFCLFAGVLMEIFGKKFDLFKYCAVTVTVLYTALSFAHPDYLIASFNVAHIADESGNWAKGNFVQSSEPYQDFYYLAGLSADAAPVLIPYMRDVPGLDMGDFQRALMDPDALNNMTVRRFNVSRYIALRLINEEKN